MRRWSVSIALVALGGLLAPLPSAAVMCGDIITDSETLTADLSCMTSPGLRIGEGGSLDMGGFKLECLGSGDGVQLTGLGAKLSNGFITGCPGTGVYAIGGGHKIERVLVSSSGEGFFVSNSGSKVSDCAALNNSVYGFYIQTGGNSVTHIIASGNSGGGIVASGGGNKISDVSISSIASAHGITLDGEGNKLSKARVSGAKIGVVVTGNFNKLSEVTSLNHVERGFQTNGSFNQLKKCVASAGVTADAGFFVGGGTGNTITGCRSLGSNNGIHAAVVNSVISKNKIFGSGGTGLSSNGSSCIIKGNHVVGSGTIDLAEVASGCSNGDVWSKNIGTRTDACIK